MDYLDSSQVLLKYVLPLGEIVLDFYDGLKGQSKGYASLDYEPHGYRTANVVKISFHLNGAPVDALSTICHRFLASPVSLWVLLRCCVVGSVEVHLDAAPLDAAHLDAAHLDAAHFDAAL